MNREEVLDKVMKIVNESKISHQQDDNLVGLDILSLEGVFPSDGVDEAVPSNEKLQELFEENAASLGFQYECPTEKRNASGNKGLYKGKITASEELGAIKDYSDYQEQKDLENYRMFMNSSMYDGIKDIGNEEIPVKLTLEYVRKRGAQHDD